MGTFLFDIIANRQFSKSLNPLAPKAFGIQSFNQQICISVTKQFYK